MSEAITQPVSSDSDGSRAPLDEVVARVRLLEACPLPVLDRSRSASRGRRSRGPDVPRRLSSRRGVAVFTEVRRGRPSRWSGFSRGGAVFGDVPTPSERRRRRECRPRYERAGPAERRRRQHLLRAPCAGSATSLSGARRPALAASSTRWRSRRISSAMPIYQASARSARAAHPVPRERAPAHRGGHRPGGLLRQRVDPLPPEVALPRHGARRLRADRARRVGARRPCAPLKTIDAEAGGRRGHRPAPADVEHGRRDLALPPRASRWRASSATARATR